MSNVDVAIALSFSQNDRIATADGLIAFDRKSNCSPDVRIAIDRIGNGLTHIRIASRHHSIAGRYILNGSGAID